MLRGEPKRIQQQKSGCGITTDSKRILRSRSSLSLSRHSQIYEAVTIADEEEHTFEGEQVREDENEENKSLWKNKSPFLGGISKERFWLCFGVILSVYFISCFDGTIMASSHPVITSYFQASNSASWLSTAFLLASTAFQPLLGRLSDTVGRKPLYLLAIAVFCVATVWCAVAQSMASFVAARAVCGLGAGGCVTLGSIMVSDLVPIEHHATYQSYINIIFGLGSAWVV